MAKLLWLICIAIIASVSGSCPPAPESLKSPDLQRIKGLWYKVATTTPYGGGNFKCNKAYNTYFPENKTEVVTTYNYDSYDGPETLDWYGLIYDNPSGGYKNTLQKNDGKKATYFVYYSDDYSTLQIIYACAEDNGVPANEPIIWIQSRECKYNEKIFQQALQILSKVKGINEIKWNKFGSPECCPAK